MSSEATRPVAVVVGVGPALGASLVRVLSARGYAVAAMARTRGTTEALATDGDDQHGPVLPVVCDVADPASVQSAFAAVREQLGDVDVLMYNAAAIHIGPFLETSAEDFERCWRVGCLGAVRCAQEVLPGMVERGTGAVFFTGATAALRGSAKFGAFASAKFGLRAVAQSMAREFGPQGIHVAHFIVDGLIWGEQSRDRFGAPEEACLNPDAIAGAYFGVLSQHRSAWTHELDLRPFGERW